MTIAAANHIHALANNQTKATVTNHLMAFFEKSLDGVVRDYAPDAVFILRDGALHGVEEIRNFFAHLIGELPAGFLDAFKMHRQEFIGELGYIVWEALPWVPLGTDTFVVRGGKIVQQTFAAYPASFGRAYLAGRRD